MANPSADSQLEAAAELVLAHRKAQSRTVSVAISGIDGAGKSTFARRLERRIASAGVAVAVVEGDGFLTSRAARYRPGVPPGRAYYELGFDYSVLADRVLPAVVAGGGRDLVVPIRDLISDVAGTRVVRVPAHGVLIVEGMFLLREPLRSRFDVTIWIEIEVAVAMARAAARPRDIAHYGSPHQVLNRFRQRHAVAHHLHLENDHPHRASDLVVTERTGRT
jgi:uridine kinase